LYVPCMMQNSVYQTNLTWRTVGVINWIPTAGLRQTSWIWDPKVIFCIMRFGGVDRWIPGFSLITQFKRHVETSQSFLPLSKLTLQVEQQAVQPAPVRFILPSNNHQVTEATLWAL